MNRDEPYIIDELLKQNYSSLINTLTQIIQDDTPQNSLQVQIQRGLVYLKMNNYEKAREDIYSWVHKHPYSFLGYYNAFICEYRCNRGRNALKMLNSSISLLYCQKFLKIKDFSLLNRAQGYHQNLLVYVLMLNEMFQQRKYVDIFETLSNVPKNIFPNFLSEQIKCFIYHKKNNQTMMRVYFDEYTKSKKYSLLQSTFQQEIQHKKQNQAVNQQIFTNLEIFENLYNDLYSNRTAHSHNSNGVYFIVKGQQELNIKEIKIIRQSEAFIENLKLQQQIEKEEKLVSSARKSQTRLKNENKAYQWTKNINESSNSELDDNIYPIKSEKERIQIKLLKAQLLNDKQMLFNMDPYCVIQYGGNQFKSNVHKNGGKNPYWNQFFVAPIPSSPTQLVVQVYDKERFKFSDDFVGKGQRILNKIGPVSLQIYEKDILAGYVYLAIQKQQNQW